MSKYCKLLKKGRKMRKIIKNIHFVGYFVQRVYQKLTNSPPVFVDSNNYWVNRYRRGGNSGAGSYNQLAEFKAEILNDFVKKAKISTVIEYGCGDGNQLRLANYQCYLGFDISPDALNLCKQIFMDDANKNFKMVGDYNNETADLAISLDVIYHLPEDEVFEDYMNRLFESAQKYVVIYSSDYDGNRSEPAGYFYPRKFTEWVSLNKKEWTLIDRIPNKYPFNEDLKTGSLADFYIYERA